MEEIAKFLATMAALSTSVQTFVEHVIKKRLTWLDEATPEDGVNENRRQTAIHVASFLVAGGLAWSVELAPLGYLDIEVGRVANSLAAGLMVSFGGSFFDEALGAMREFKKAKRSLREGQEANG